MKAQWMIGGLLAGLVGASTALAGESIDERRSVNADATIVINNVKGEVNVQSWSRSEVHVTGSLGDGTRGLTVTGNDNRVSVNVKFPRNAHDVEDTILNIQVPEGASLEIDTVSADIEVDDVSGDRIEANSVSGEIEIRANPGRLDLESVSGDIGVETESERITMETVSGDIEGDDLTGELNITTVSGDALISTKGLDRGHFESVSGDVELDLEIANGADINVASLSGDVDLALAKGLSAEVDVESFSGSIRSDQGSVKSARHGPQKSLSFRAGDGSGRIRIESFSGNVSIHSR